ncbi:hypothetical protein JNK13_01575 [bacterium]|nr:hypothetical protein [bacterium]
MEDVNNLVFAVRVDGRPSDFTIEVYVGRNIGTDCVGTVIYNALRELLSQCEVSRIKRQYLVRVYADSDVRNAILSGRGNIAHALDVESITLSVQGPRNFAFAPGCAGGGKAKNRV